MLEQLTLASLMCSKLCHDLAAPLSAISIGLDMLPEATDPDAPQKLLQYSVQSAMNKLELLRFISGGINSSNFPTLDEAIKTINKSIEADKIKLYWQCPIDDAVKGQAVRLLSILIVLSIDALPRGGTITIHPNFSIEVAGPYVKFNDEVMSALVTTKEELTSRGILGHLAYLLSEALETKIIVTTLQANHVNFSFA